MYVSLYGINVSMATTCMSSLTKVRLDMGKFQFWTPINNSIHINTRKISREIITNQYLKTYISHATKTKSNDMKKIQNEYWMNRIHWKRNSGLEATVVTVIENDNVFIMQDRRSEGFDLWSNVSHPQQSLKSIRLTGSFLGRKTIKLKGEWNDFEMEEDKTDWTVALWDAPQNPLNVYFWYLIIGKR